MNDDENYSTWIHDVDKNYFIPQQPILTQDNKMNKYLKLVNLEDITEVLDGFLYHPTVHQHISEDNRHEIRIGGGFYNPYQFLFHLRYQLCLIKENRESEKNRLISMFYEAIRKKCNGIAPSKLLNII